MTREFYPSRITAESRTLLKELKELASRVGNITLLGGWAVHELVDEVYALESQDIDLLIHADKAWTIYIEFFEKKGFKWRFYRDRKGDRHRDQRLILPGHEPLAIDIFYSQEINPEILRALFATEWSHGFKSLKYQGFVPGIDIVLLDKFQTIKTRRDKSKQIKDVLDIHSLLFHNKQNIEARELMTGEILEIGISVRPILSELDNDERCSDEIAEILKIMK